MQFNYEKKSFTVSITGKLLLHHHPNHKPTKSLKKTFKILTYHLKLQDGHNDFENKMTHFDPKYRMYTRYSHP